MSRGARRRALLLSLLAATPHRTAPHHHHYHHTIHLFKTNNGLAEGARDIAQWPQTLAAPACAPHPIRPSHPPSSPPPFIHPPHPLSSAGFLSGRPMLCNSLVVAPIHPNMLSLSPPTPHPPPPTPHPTHTPIYRSTLPLPRCNAVSCGLTPHLSPHAAAQPLPIPPFIATRSVPPPPPPPPHSSNQSVSLGQVGYLMCCDPFVFISCCHRSTAQ